MTVDERLKRRRKELGMSSRGLEFESQHSDQKFRKLT